MPPERAGVITSALAIYQQLGAPNRDKRARVSIWTAAPLFFHRQSKSHLFVGELTKRLGARQRRAFPCSFGRPVTRNELPQIRGRRVAAATRSDLRLESGERKEKLSQSPNNL